MEDHKDHIKPNSVPENGPKQQPVASEGTQEWFGQWFNSPYYHVLYKNRDYGEAQAFIDALNGYFEFGKEDVIIDLACGKGRHAIYLNALGLHVVGLDLSPQSIAAASASANSRLHFYVHDMRQVFQHPPVDYVLNLFTSFGYFETKEEHAQAIAATAQVLKPGGKLLLDFLNPYRVVHNLVAEEVKEMGGIEFHITRYLSADDYIVKDIKFENEGQAHHFQERVKAIRRTEFLEYFNAAGLVVEAVFGDYQLGAYDKACSERMIFVTKKQG